MTPTRADATASAAESIAMYRSEVAQRAALLYRLGYTVDQATARLQANVDWDFEIGAGPRPKGLDAHAIAEIVATTFARRPSH